MWFRPSPKQVRWHGSGSEPVPSDEDNTIPIRVRVGQGCFGTIGIFGLIVGIIEILTGHFTGSSQSAGSLLIGALVAAAGAMVVLRTFSRKTAREFRDNPQFWKFPWG